jgi:integrase
VTSLLFAASADVVSPISCSPTVRTGPWHCNGATSYFHGRFTNVQRVFSRGKIETPKNGKPRRVDMSLQLRDALKDVKLERRLEAVKKGWGSIPEWVFVSETGMPLISIHWRSRVI